MSDQQTITPLDERAQFNDGARQGHILYCQAHQGKILCPRDVYDLLMTVLLDTTHPSMWNAGYIAGWFVALCQLPQQSTAPLTSPAMPPTLSFTDEDCAFYGHEWSGSDRSGEKRCVLCGTRGYCPRCTPLGSKGAEPYFCTRHTQMERQVQA